MTGNQSEAEKDNRLLFGEQWILLLSKYTMATTNFSQSESELGSCDVTKMGAPTKVRPCWKQLTSLDRGLGSVLPISMATQITTGSRKNVRQLQNRYLQCPVVLNGRCPSCKRHDEDCETWVLGLTIGWLSQSIMGR